MGGAEIGGMLLGVGVRGHRAGVKTLRACTMNRLPGGAVTSAGEAFVIHFPPHPETRSGKR
jgi:hypothetical protein